MKVLILQQVHLDNLVVAFKTKYEYERQTPTDVYLRVLDKLIAARKDVISTNAEWSK